MFDGIDLSRKLKLVQINDAKNDEISLQNVKAKIDIFIYNNGWSKMAVEKYSIWLMKKLVQKYWGF